MAWTGNPQTNRDMHTHWLSHTHTHTHRDYNVRYQWVFPQLDIAQSWLASHHHPSLKDFSRNAVQNSPETLMILRTEWCHALVRGVLGTEALTPAECTTASPRVCVSVKCVCAVVWSAKVKNGSEPVFFNEASEESGGWTGCVNKRAIWSSPPNETSPFIHTREEKWQEEWAVT